MSARTDVIGTIQSTIDEQAPGRQSVEKLLDWALLPLFMIMAPLLFYFRVQYNLPLAANVDERTALDIFHRFQSGGLNPHFFLYPTFYYYVTYFFTKLFTPSNILVGGRILNLSFVGLTSFVAYSFCRIQFQSRAAGILSALFVLTSATVVHSGSYICTDALLAATVLACLFLLVQYFQDPTLRNWLISMGMIGIAVSCKYTALVLFFAYAGTEMIREIGRDQRGTESEPRVARPVLVLTFGVFGGLLLATAWALPVPELLRFATAHHTSPDLKSSDDYLLFFQHVRKVLFLGSASLLLLGFMVLRTEFTYRLVSVRRLWLGLAIVLSIAALTSPYSILDAPKFIYDLGAQARATLMLQEGARQWMNYYAWVGNESKVLVLLGLLGFITIALRQYQRYMVVILFVAIYVFSIGNAHIGFPRYLTPLLPVVYVFTAGFLLQIWRLKKAGSFPSAKIVAGLLVLGAVAEIWPKFESNRELSKRSDEFWSSYHVALNSHAAKVLYAGYAPSAELSAAGIPTTQTSWASLGSMPLGSQLQCGELLIFDRSAAEAHNIAPARDPSVTVLLDDRSGDYGQEVLRRVDCK